MKTIILASICAIAILTKTTIASSLVNFDVPNTYSTTISGADGSNIIGMYNFMLKSETGNKYIGPYHGFIYNGTSISTIDRPSADATYPRGIYGNTIVGFFTSAGNTRGFSYNLGTNIWTTLDSPYGVATTPQGISGSTIVGSYDSSSTSHGFTFNGTTWSTMTPPTNWSVNNLRAQGISGNIIVGSYDTSFSNAAAGFVYNGSTWAKLTPPANWDVNYLYPNGVYSNVNNETEIVGIYYDSVFTQHSFLYNKTANQWTNFDSSILPSGSTPEGGSGANFVGSYSDGSGATHGFIYTVPEPTSFAFLAIGSLLLLRKKH